MKRILLENSNYKILHNYANKINISILVDSLEYESSCFNTSINTINIKANNWTLKECLIIILHELGHAIQDTDEYEFECKYSMYEKAAITYKHEVDAWNMGMYLLELLKLDITLVEFYTLRNWALNRYFNKISLECIMELENKDPFWYYKKLVSYY